MEKLSYASAMSELEEIVAQLQSPDCDVDKLCELTRRSVELLKFCKQKLSQTDEDLVKLLENIN